MQPGYASDKTWIINSKNAKIDRLDMPRGEFELSLLCQK